MFRKALLIVAALGFFLGACTTPATPLPTNTPAPTATPAPIVLTDGLGRSVELAAPAQKVVSLAASNTEILFAIEAGSQTVGRDEFSDYPEAAKALPSVGGSFGKYNVEAIVALQPDLVLAAEINTPEQVKALEDAGLSVYYLSNPTTLDELYQNLLIVAQLTGRTAEAETLVASLKERVTAVLQKIPALAIPLRVYYELDATDANAPYTTGPGTFMDMFIGLAGGANVAGEMDSPWVQLSAEKLVELNPQVILLGDAAYGVTPEAVKARPGWETMDAVKNNKIFPFDDNLASRPGPRLVDGLEALAKLLYPDVFK